MGSDRRDVAGSSGFLGRLSWGGSLALAGILADVTLYGRKEASPSRVDFHQSKLAARPVT
jgi:hypothetical protein